MVVLWTVAFGSLLIAIVLNNITIATQDMTDYRYVLWPSVALFLCSAGCLIQIARRAGWFGLIACGILATTVLLQLYDLAPVKWTRS